MSFSLPGLTSEQAASRLNRYGRNEVAEERGAF
jgi:Cation transporter/ATPase, N-terminus